MKGKGDCIIMACVKVIEDSKLLFCYAYVIGQQTLQGQRILHAWNEYQDVVLDFSNGKKVVMRKEKYYKLAKIKEKDIVRQKASEVKKLMLKHETYGGWIK